MSSKPQKARTGSKPEVHALSPIEDTETLSPQEIKRLNFLGYKQADIAALSVEEARYRLENKKAKPGSKAFLKNAVSPLTGVKGSSPIAGHFDNEAIETRNAGKDRALVIQDEWEGKGLQAAGLLFDQLDKPYRDANPGMVFRWLHPDTVKLLGSDGFQDVHDGNGQRVMCADHWLAFKPREVQEQQDARFAEEVNAPFQDVGGPQGVDLGSVKGGRPVPTRESTLRRGDEMPHYVPLDS